MEKTFNPNAVEQALYQHWEAQGYFKPNGDTTQDAYCIMIPPPNVTGSLHMGHAFQQTIMDALIRYQRMQGKNTLWQAGTDHAGIATQMVVERKIAAEEGKSRHDYGRDAFIDKIWQWKEESGGTITRQMRRLGTSVDWDRERFTMDPGLSRAVHRITSYNVCYTKLLRGEHRTRRHEYHSLRCLHSRFTRHLQRRRSSPQSRRTGEREDQGSSRTITGRLQPRIEVQVGPREEASYNFV